MKGDSVFDSVCARIRVLAVSVPACLILLGCTASDPIVIGFLGGITGRGADLGIAARDGVQLAVEECNRAGGVAGRKLTLIIKDDEQNAEVAQKATRELIDSGAVAIVGSITSTMAKAIMPIAEKAGIILVSSSAVTDELTGKDDPLFRVNMSTSDSAGWIARYHLQEQPPMLRVVGAYDLKNRSYTERWLAAFSETYARGGGQVVKTIGFESGGETAFRQVAQNLLATPSDGVVIAANSMDTAMLCQQIRKLGSPLPIIASGWAGTERLLELGGRAVEGVKLAQNFDRESTAPRYQAFRKAYIERFQREPGYSGTLCFEAASVVIEALAKNRDPKKLKETVLTVRRFEGLQSPIVFDEFGDVKRPLSMTVIRNGSFAVIR